VKVFYPSGTPHDLSVYLDAESRYSIQSCPKHTVP